MPQLVALLDTNVLYSAPSRDIHLQLAHDNLYEAKWTQAILCELRRLLAAMNQSFPNASISGFENYIQRLNLPDPKDHHVLAAAVVGKCDLLITRNVRHFPDEYLTSLGIRVSSPDDFLAALLLSNPEKFCKSVSSVLSRLNNPAYTSDQYLSHLRTSGLIQTSMILERYQDRFA
ncbi:MAG: PIN domain-containing protein [Chloroflexi bacterium]|nr:PIN domain-containing protein [Chloroflexota bacterium]